MGQRRDFRFETVQPVGLTILGKHSQDADVLLAASMVNLSGRGLSLTTESCVPVGSAVRIDIKDNILLGEVCHSRQTGPSAFVCGVQLEQALTDVHDLSRLMSRLMGESQRAAGSPAPADMVSGSAKMPTEEAVADGLPKERRRLSALLFRL
jgi:hypothetical protein